MDAERLSNIAVFAIQGDDDTIGPYSSIHWGTLERLNEVSSIIKNNSVVVCDQAYEHLGFLLSSSRIFLYSDTSVPDILKPKLQVVKTTHEVLNLLRRKSDYCYVLGGKKAFQDFMPFASKIYLTKPIGALYDVNEFVQFNLNEWKEAKEVLGKANKDRLIFFKEFYRRNNSQKPQSFEPSIRKIFGPLPT